jgi:hypothetical protein
MGILRATRLREGTVELQGFEKRKFALKKGKNCRVTCTRQYCYIDPMFLPEYGACARGFFAMLGRSDPYPRRTLFFSPLARG